MSRSAILRPRARLDLQELALQLATQSEDTALRFIDAVQLTLDRLARMPGLGQAWPAIQPQLAGLRVGTIDGFPNHLVYYQPGDEGIRVIRILHGARDVSALLDQEGLG